MPEPMTEPIPPTPRRRRRWPWTLGGIAVALVAALVILRPGATLPKPPPVPSPNAYVDLVRAGGMVAQPMPNQGDVFGAPVDALRAWVDASRAALTLADEAIDKPSAVPLAFNATEPTLFELGSVRDLARLMMADVLVARADARPDEAVDRCFELIAMARSVNRNGLMIHRLTEVALEHGFGLEGLALLRDDLDADACRSAARRLLDLDASADGPDETLALEADWARATMTRQMRLAVNFVPGVRSTLRKLTGPAEEALRLALRRVSARRRVLAADLAIRAYRLDHEGALPDRLDAMVPDDLPRVPTDPFDPGVPLRYQPGDDGSYVLYSVGPDGNDDGGTPYPPKSNWSKTRGDLTAGPLRQAPPPSP